MRTRKSDRDLTPEQRRRELIDFLGMAAARMPAARSITEGAAASIPTMGQRDQPAIPPDPPPDSARERLSESGQTRLDVSAERPLNVTTG